MSMEAILASWFQGDKSLFGLFLAGFCILFDLGVAFSFDGHYFVVQIPHHFLGLLQYKRI